jgi:hypothetical protein
VEDRPSSGLGEIERELRLMGVDPDRLSRRVARLLLGQEPPGAELVQAALAGLHGQGLDAVGVQRVLALVPIEISAETLRAGIERADLQRAVRDGPGENFAVRGVVRHEHAGGPRFEVRLLRIDRAVPDEISVDIGIGDLESEWRFVSKCIRALSFAPVLKPAYRSEHFRSFASLLVGATDAPMTKPEHGTLHGRPARTPETDDLLVQAIRACVVQAGGTLETRVTPLYEQVCRYVSERGELPLDWPGTPTALGYGFRRWGDALERSGVEWRRRLGNGTRRVPLYILRIRSERKPDRAA